MKEAEKKNLAAVRSFFENFLLLWFQKKYLNLKLENNYFLQII